MSAVLAPGARIQCRDAEWLVRSVRRSSDGEQLLEVVGVSPFLREQQARFLVNLEPDLKVLQPEETELVADPSPRYRDSLLFLEAHLRKTVPTGPELVVGHRAAMDVMNYQLQPAAKALAMPRQRLLIADAVGLGKTLECGILISELIRRGRGRRILVVTTRSMLGQFQKEFWTRFSIPLVRLDSTGIQRIREQIPGNANPFHHFDRTIVSVDTLKNDREYRVYLDEASWDIIVIDECQNVAARGKSAAQNSQRARLAKRLATRSDTLLLLSATPHDGRPESFASLMTMLDPTAISDPHNYGPADIRDLYVRRFRKDVLADLRRHVPERDPANVESPASAAEERVFAALAKLKLPDSDAKAKAGELFRTTLLKSLLSSPMACLETVRNRLRRLKEAPADQQALEALLPLLEPIGPAEFSKYQRLIQLIRDDWGWTGRDPRDRLVIFTGRRETQRFLMEHLATALNLPADAVVQLDGAMLDTDQTKVVEHFAQEKEAVRILVATEVASEGLNLHYLSHRLIHFDIPWSLMTLQQRNGRIDRYGQNHQPLLRYMLTASTSPGMGDAEKILKVLIRKDDQAQKNIGDPSVFMKVFDAEEEEGITAKAIERGDATFEQELDANAAPFLRDATGDELIAELFGTTHLEPEATPTPPQAAAVGKGTCLSLFPDLWSYVSTAIQAAAEQLAARNEPMQMRPYPEQQRLELTPPADLQRRYERFPRELRPERGKQLALSTNPDALQAALKQALREENARPELEYLWDLHPLVEWLSDRGLVAFARHQAPVLQLQEAMAPGQTVMVLQGTIPNLRGVPVVQEWVAVSFAGSGLKEVAVEPFAVVAERLQLGRKAYANPQAAVPLSLRDQRKVAVGAAQAYLLEKREQWRERTEPELQNQRERLRRLRGRQEQQLEFAFSSDGRPAVIKEKERSQRQKEINQRFEDHERFVAEVMMIEAAPYLKLVAVLHRPESGGD
jgi:superfamily II DNA or RNA helicase